MMKLKNLVLDTTEAAQVAIKYWNHDADKVKFWRGGSNYVYYFKNDEKTCFLRLSHEEENSLDKITTEIGYLQYLNENNFPCNQPIMSNNDRFIETVETLQGKYYCVLFNGVGGEFLDAEEMSIEQLEEWGRALAHLHNHSSKFDPGSKKRRSWEDILKFIDVTLKEFPNEIAAAEELERLKKWLGSLTISQENHGLIHYDFETDNISWNKELKRFTIIDFDDSMYHWYVMDIAIVFENILEGDNNYFERNCEAFLRGYTEVKTVDQSLLEQKYRFKRFDGLYTFARLMRALQDDNIENEPEWLDYVRNKLINKCNKIRKEFNKSW